MKRNVYLLNSVKKMGCLGNPFLFLATHTLMFTHEDVLKPIGY